MNTVDTHAIIQIVGRLECETCKIKNICEPMKEVYLKPYCQVLIDKLVDEMVE